MRSRACLYMFERQTGKKYRENMHQYGQDNEQMLNEISKYKIQKTNYFSYNNDGPK